MGACFRLHTVSKPKYASLNAFFEATRLTQAELAAQVGVTHSAISHYVRGRRIPQPAVALKLSAVCRVPLATLLQKATA